MIIALMVWYDNSPRPSVAAVVWENGLARPAPPPTQACRHGWHYQQGTYWQLPNRDSRHHGRVFLPMDVTGLSFCIGMETLAFDQEVAG